jgi:hypothetical protein
VTPTNIVLSIQFVASAILAILLLKKRVNRCLPIFLTYVLYSTLSNAAQLLCQSDRSLYFKVYWISETGDISLAVAATCESFFATFRGFFVLAWFKFLLPVLAAVVAAYALWKAWMHPPVLNSPLVALIVGAEIGLRYFIAGIFILYLALRRSLQIVDLRSEHNVILGFFLASAGMLLAAIVRSESGTDFPLITSWAAPAACTIALFIWVFSPWTHKEQIIDPQIDADSAFKVLKQYSSVLKKVRR